MTLLESAKKNIATKVVKIVARYENIALGRLLKGIREGKVVIPQNIKVALHTQDIYRPLAHCGAKFGCSDGDWITW